MNMLLDQVERLDLLQTRRHTFDGDLMGCIDNRFPHHALGPSYVPTADQASGDLGVSAAAVMGSG